MLNENVDIDFEHSPAIGGQWDDEFERELFTPEEIAEIDREVAKMAAVIEARQRYQTAKIEYRRAAYGYKKAKKLAAAAI